MDKGLCAFLQEESSNTSNVSYMIKGGLTDGCNLFLEVNLIIHGDPNIACSSYGKTIQLGGGHADHVGSCTGVQGQLHWVFMIEGVKDR